MKVTAITPQQKNRDRVNVMVDGVYRFSLDIFQVGELGVRVGAEYDEPALQRLEEESQFGKVYTRALEYCLVRPHSAKEVRDYLYKKTRDTRTRTGEVKKGVSPAVTQRVFERLLAKSYIDDEKFARFWVENRHWRKGASQRKLRAELQAKGVAAEIIITALDTGGRRDSDELQKVIAKKRARYPDEQKFTQYLARQGFSFDAIKAALSGEAGEE